jgi:hypothetical protein
VTTVDPVGAAAVAVAYIVVPELAAAVWHGMCVTGIPKLGYNDQSA